ncbi:MAG: sugar transporter [Porticoccaceae bacterium]|nr:sugar transporter [Porticoccaceae bacterium]
MKFLRELFLALILGSAASTFAQLPNNISAEQIAQFGALPPALQQQLAGQLGIDLAALQNLSNGGSDAANTSADVGQSGIPLEPAEPQSSAETLGPSSGIVEEQAPQLERYGLSLFDREVTTFAPVDNAPIPNDYVVGPGDSFNVLLIGTENQNLVLSVDREGVINFPRLGAITVAGLPFSEAKRVIETRVNEQLIGAEAIISAGRLRAINVFMTGEVKTPGAYSVSALTTVTQALFVAGGVSNIGSLRDIRVLRNNELVASFDSYDLLLRGDASADIRLQSGDVLFVPPVFATASIDGAVRRPAIYELIPGQTVSDLVSMAGNYETNAYVKMVPLERFDRDKALPELINLDLSNSSDSALTLIDGDYIRVPVSGELFSNSIQIKGAVVRPGIYAYEEGMRLSDLVPSVDSHLNFDVDLNYALIVSIKNERLDIEVTTFDLGRAITNPDSEFDPVLRSRDEILIFDLPDVSEETSAGIQSNLNDQNREDSLARNLAGNTAAAAEQIQEQSNRRELLAPVITKLRLQSRENEPVQIVSVSGAVKAPGEYPLREGDRLSVLLSAAGGLTDDAYLSDAELRRVVVDSAGFVDAQVDSIDLSLRFSDEGHNPVLQSRDHIFVRTIPDWTPNRSAVISGEVRFPGTYQIGPRETIANLIERAGGLTNVGFASGAVFTRDSARQQQRDQLQEYVEDIRKTIAAKSLTLEEQNVEVLAVENIISLLTSQEPLGRLIIDLPEILSGNEGADLVLQDGDSIIIPRQTTTIAVIGEVRRPGVYRYQQQLGLEDYVELGAGMTVRAHDEALYVVKADGSVNTVREELFRFSGAQNRLEPGDTIVVPVNPEYRDSITYWSTITSIVYQTGIAVAGIVAIL